MTHAYPCLWQCNSQWLSYETSHHVCQQIKNVVYTHTEFYSGIKKDKIISFAGKWMKFDSTKLSKRKPDSESQVICFLSCGIQKGKKGRSRGVS